MVKYPRFLAAIFALTLFNLFLSGCAQQKEMTPEVVQPKVAQPVPVLPERVKKVQSDGCLNCHGPGADAIAEDFSDIFNNPKSHHPFGIRYPDAAVVSNFAPPNGQRGDVVFFDRNANGQPDSDEIVMYGASGEATIECASCHKEHGDTTSTEKDPERLYLRFENIDSALCTTCHQY